MNTSLITQLELALAVERGKVPREEIQHRRCFEGTMTMEWYMSGIPTWNFQSFEYRRKPKLLECWVAEYGPGHHKLLWTQGQEASSRPPDRGEPTRMILMREVTNE